MDLNNFRTVPQPDEEAAIRTMVSIKPEWFWALTESVLETGYLLTETIIVQKDKGKLVVKEGNRRLAALKLILKFLNGDDLSVPSHIKTKMGTVTAQWKKDNAEVPCVVYEASETVTVDRIVTLTHGKAQQAGRDQWTPVARARHNRISHPAAEAGLDLLEKYLQTNRSVNSDQKDRWSGDYPLTVLDEMMKRNAKRFGVETSRELAAKYPKVKNR